MAPGDSNEARLTELLCLSAATLLADLGVQPEWRTGVRQPPPTGESVAAFSGFANNELRGSFALLGPRKLFARLHPLPQTMTLRDWADWARELVSQAVGRFCNRLLAYGVQLATSVPQGALAKEVRLASSLDPARSPILFTIEGLVLEGWLELDIAPSFRLEESPLHEARAALREGTIVFF